MCTYTFIFGLYSAFIFTRTKSLIVVFSLHAYCNFMSLPDFGSLIQLREYPHIQSKIEKNIFKEQLKFICWGYFYLYSLAYIFEVFKMNVYI
jgi:hypothetical protein